jgi:hypothetical protein
VTNTLLTYYGTELITDVNIFMIQAPIMAFTVSPGSSGLTLELAMLMGSPREG